MLVPPCRRPRSGTPLARLILQQPRRFKTRHSRRDTGRTAMIISSTPGDLRTQSDRSATPASRCAGEMSTPGRAVVAVTPIGRAEPAPLNQPDASFVVHLIATATAAESPQTPGPRRATPDAARAAYDTTARRNVAPDAPDRQTVSRTA